MRLWGWTVIHDNLILHRWRASSSLKLAMQVLRCKAVAAGADTLAGLLPAESVHGSQEAGTSQRVSKAVAVIDRPLQENESQVCLLCSAYFPDRHVPKSHSTDPVWRSKPLGSRVVSGESRQMSDQLLTSVLRALHGSPVKPVEMGGELRQATIRAGAGGAATWRCQQPPPRICPASGFRFCLCSSWQVRATPCKRHSFPSQVLMTELRFHRAILMGRCLLTKSRVEKSNGRPRSPLPVSRLQWQRRL